MSDTDPGQAEPPAKPEIAPEDPGEHRPAGPPSIAEPEGPGEAYPDESWGRTGPWVTVLSVLVVGAGLVLRFWARSALWLDEALSVNIASLPLSDLHGALRQDGHPPLYYVLLHGWMDLFGQGDRAVRTLSGLFAVALLPLIWVAGTRLGGRRVALYAVLLTALSPYALRYATETRMYALVALLALMLWLVTTSALERPVWWRLVAIALGTGVLLWTHYWAMWFLAAGMLGTAMHGWRAHRAGERDVVRASMLVLGAAVVGCATFLPWVPTLLYQGAHTGTPWARPVRPTEMVFFTEADLGGGGPAEGPLLGVLLTIAALLGVFGLGVSSRRIDLDLRTRPRSRPLLILLAVTLTLACVAGYVTSATYATRYASVLFPFVMLLAALGIDTLRSRPIAIGALSILLALGAIGGYRNVVYERTDARRNGIILGRDTRPGDWIVYCPDQLGPSGDREAPPGRRQVVFPTFAGPERVDWVDYKQRLDDVDVAAFAQELLRRAGEHRIAVVYHTGYVTHAKLCPALIDQLQAARESKPLALPGMAYEPSAVVLFPPRSEHPTPGGSPEGGAPQPGGGQPGGGQPGDGGGGPLGS